MQEIHLFLRSKAFTIMRVTLYMLLVMVHMKDL